ncbi:hypothetical protein GBA52_009003, partial [Prunus armeniaca]
MVFRGCHVQVGSVVLGANLIPLEIVDLNFILGMDWLVKLQGCSVLKPGTTGVVQQFLDVFPYDLPRLPPHHDIEFTIELVGEE